jgi:hypothetical protein
VEKKAELILAELLDQFLILVLQDSFLQYKAQAVAVAVLMERNGGQDRLTLLEMEEQAHL